MHVATKRGLVERNDGITPQDQEQARGRNRSVQDQQRLRLTTRRRRERRARRPVPVLLQSLIRNVKAVHVDIVHNERGELEAVLRFAAYKLVHWFGLTASFLAAHSMGWVSRKTWQHRRTWCDLCTLREVVNGADYCGAIRGGRGCGCSRQPWWKLSQLNYQLWLGRFACPVEWFGRGSLIRGAAWGLGTLLIATGLILGLIEIVA